MIKLKKYFVVIGIANIIIFSMTVCNKGSNAENPNNSSPQITSATNDNIESRISPPEPMSEKTAFEYFRDEGIIVGINLACTFDAIDVWTNPERPISVETAWHSPIIRPAIFYGYKRQSFQIVRIPITWIGHIGPAPDYKIEESWLQRIAEVVGYAKDAGLKVIINMHNDDNYHYVFKGWLFLNKVKDDPSILDQYEKMWKQIAGHFINCGEWLMFEGFNEMHDGNWGINNQLYIVLNDVNQRFTNAVRSTGGNNIRRYLVYNGYWTSWTISEDSLRFRLPDDISAGRQIVSIHYYEPHDFAMLGINPNWGTEQEKKAIDNYFDVFRRLFTDKNVPVIIGESGPPWYLKSSENSGYNAAYVPIARQNRLNYIDYFYSRARENGLIPFFWEGTEGPEPEDSRDTGYNLFNRSTGQPSSVGNAEVIRHMINAINNPIPRDKIKNSSFVDFWSWNTFADDASTINSSQRYGAFTINGNVSDTVQYGYAACLAQPDSATLNKLKTSASVSFKVKGDGKTYKLVLPTSDITDYGYYEKTFQTRNGEETAVTINFSDLTQPVWAAKKPLTKSLIQHFHWYTVSPGSFNLTISDVVLR
jgi:endoglucanase